MSGSTPLYGMAFFDFRDRLDTQPNIQKEIERFMLIDKQLYGMYLIFGNGVIDGWDVLPNTQSNNLSIAVDISIGNGIISYLACETTVPTTLYDLPANDQFYIYAVIRSGTVIDRSVEFIWARTSPGANSVRLARVTTGSSGVDTVDSSFKDEINFLEIIKEEIQKHKHRGSPSKIDLQTETRNQLPGARIENFDASKITSGRFGESRIPQLDHNNLENNGLLTHAALDSFVRNINAGNRQLLGEVTASNMIKQLIFAAYKDSSAIEHVVNLLPVIPGVTPTSYIDFDNSTANISLSTGCISGLPSHTGQITSVTWDTTSAFLTAYDKSQVAIATDSVSLLRGGGSSKTIENFELVPQAGVSIPGFSVDTQIIQDNLTITSENAESFKIEGFYSGKFNTDREYRALFIKEITSNNDWSIYDELVLDVKSISVSHGAVYMYFVNGEGESAVNSQIYLVLGEDEVTTNPDPLANAFERRSFTISDEQRSNIKKIIIYTDDIKTKHVFWIDNIFIRNQALYPPTGFIKLRYSGGVNVNFNSVSYESSLPDGTSIRVRVKTANSPLLLNRASFTPSLNSGDVFSRDGTDAEIEITLYSNESKTLTPSLTSVSLQMIVSSSQEGFIINEADEWDRGEYINTSRETDQSTLRSYVSIAPNVPVGDFYYSFKNVISQTDPDKNSVCGISGLSLPVSPKQALNYASSQGQIGLYKPYSVYRLDNTNFIIADTDNDRIVEINRDGTFVRGIGSHNESSSDYFYPLTATYNSNTGILTSTFTKPINTSTTNKKQIRLWIGNSYIDLGTNDEIMSQTINSRILQILLSTDKQEQLNQTASNVYVDFRPGTFTETFNSTTNLQQLYGAKGLSVFIGDFTFIEGISHPIFANQMSNNNWVVGNSEIVVETPGSQDTRIVQRVAIGTSTSFTAQVPAQPTGVAVSWEVNIPADLQGVVTYSGPNNIVTVNINNPTSAQIREWTIPIIAIFRNATTGAEIARDQKTAILVIYDPAQSGSTTTTNPISSMFEINMENKTIEFSYSGLVFSDFSLGSIYEVDSNRFLVAGLSETEDPMNPATQTPPPLDETFEQQAARKLNNYRGKLLIVDKSTKAISFEYTSPDGSYLSDAVVDNNGFIVAAESTFANSNGRIIKIDEFGNIVWQIGSGLFAKINDVRSQYNGNVVIST